MASLKARILWCSRRMDFENRSVYEIHEDRSCHPTLKPGKKMVFRGVLMSLQTYIVVIMPSIWQVDYYAHGI